MKQHGSKTGSTEGKSKIDKGEDTGPEGSRERGWGGWYGHDGSDGEGPTVLLVLPLRRVLLGLKWATGTYSS